MTRHHTVGLAFEYLAEDIELGLRNARIGIDYYEECNVSSQKRNTVNRTRFCN
jgi:hypothetical protein